MWRKSTVLGEGLCQRCVCVVSALCLRVRKNIARHGGRNLLLGHSNGRKDEEANPFKQWMDGWKKMCGGADKICSIVFSINELCAIIHIIKISFWHYL